MNLFQVFKMSCREATCLHTKKQEGKLSFAESLGLKIHMAYCSLCRLFFSQLDEVEKQAHRLSRSQKVASSLSDSEKEKMKQVMQQKING